MNVFEIAKSNVTVLQAAEYYGMKTNARSMVRCPFHDDRTPSLKLNKDYFYCFGCGATGDVIELVSKLFCIKPYEAAKKLCSEFGLNADSINNCLTVNTHYPTNAASTEDELRCQRILNKYLKLLNYWKYEYAPKSPDDELDERFVEACNLHDYVEYVSALIAVSVAESKEKAIASLIKSGTIEIIERKLKEHLEEAIYGHKCAV